jgi:hypothetical protein
MAQIINLQQQEEEKKDPTKEQPLGGDRGGLITGGTGLSPDKLGARGSGFIRTQKYLTANVPKQGIGIAGAITQKSQEHQQQALENIQQQAEQQSKAIQEGLPEALKASQQAAAPTPAAPSMPQIGLPTPPKVPEATSTTTGRTVPTYKFPTQIGDIGKTISDIETKLGYEFTGPRQDDIERSLTKSRATEQALGELARGLTKEEGRREAVGSLFRKPTYTAGQRALDLLLLGTPESQAELRKIRQQAGDVAQRRQDELERLGGLAERAESKVRSARQVAEQEGEALARSLVKDIERKTKDIESQREEAKRLATQYDPERQAQIDLAKDQAANILSRMGLVPTENSVNSMAKKIIEQAGTFDVSDQELRAGIVDPEKVAALQKLAGFRGAGGEIIDLPEEFELSEPEQALSPQQLIGTYGISQEALDESMPAIETAVAPINERRKEILSRLVVDRGDGYTLAENPRVIINDAIKDGAVHPALADNLAKLDRAELAKVLDEKYRQQMWSAVYSNI